ncbi:MAG: diguanylate cyclase [Synergistetes bacterium]|nr:diguanylate cyclase [Synergistota bacterium]
MADIGGGRKVLIIDDSKFDVMLLADVLRNMGFIPICSNTSREGVMVAEEELPSIVLLDIVMPDIDGIETIKLLHQKKNPMEMPVIMVTSLDKPEYVKAALDAGAVDYVKKPFSEMELVARVRAALRQKQLYEELKQMNERLTKLAVTDGLTGVYNHMYLMEKLKEQFHISSRYGHCFSFVMLDIDFFKKVNDRYGHSVGDCVLKGVSKSMKESVRSADIVGRYGGEEFSVIMPMVNAEGACVASERIRKSIGEEEFICGEGRDVEGVKITVSIGVSSCPDGHIGGYSEMVVAADKALYEAKRSGRNRVYCFREGNIKEFKLNGGNEL